MVHHYEDGPEIKVTNEKIKKKADEILRLKKEKDRLIEEEETKNKKAVQLSDRLKGLKELKNKNQKEIIEVTLELNKHCTHEKIRTETRNYSGGYLDRAEYWTYYFCEICGVKIDEQVEYGGFA